jgi:hypothetical protein
MSVTRWQLSVMLRAVGWGVRQIGMYVGGMAWEQKRRVVTLW